MNPLTYIVLLVLTVVLAAFLSVKSFILASVVFWPLVIFITAMFLFREKPVRVEGVVFRGTGSHMEM